MVFFQLFLSVSYQKRTLQLQRFNFVEKSTRTITLAAEIYRRQEEKGL